LAEYIGERGKRRIKAESSPTLLKRYEIFFAEFRVMAASPSSFDNHPIGGMKFLYQRRERRRKNASAWNGWLRGEDRLVK